MNEKEQAKVEKIRAETKEIYYNIALKWYLAIAGTVLGGTPLINYLKDFFK